MSELGDQARRLYERHGRHEVSDRLLRLGVLLGHPAAETIASGNAPEEFAPWLHEVVSGERVTAARAALAAATLVLPLWRREATEHPGLTRALTHLEHWIGFPNQESARFARAAAERAKATACDAGMEIGRPTKWDTLNLGCTTLRVGDPLTCKVKWRGQAETAYQSARHACRVPSSEVFPETAKRALTLAARLVDAQAVRAFVSRELLPWVSAWLLPEAN